MENYPQETMKSLANLSKINEARIEGYKSAISKACQSDMKRYFTEKNTETLNLTSQIKHVMDELGGSDNEKINEDNERLLRPNFYFTMAKASDNPRTVLLSCQLGDECAVTTYKAILKSKTVKLLPYLQEILTKQLSNLEESLSVFRQILFDTTFA